MSVWSKLVNLLVTWRALARLDGSGRRTRCPASSISSSVDAGDYESTSLGVGITKGNPRSRASPSNFRMTTISVVAN